MSADSVWWLSFADPDLPPGTQFLGVVILNAPDFMSAVLLSHALKLNPGGEVQGVELPIPNPLRAQDFNRLLSRDECAAIERRATEATP